MAPVARRLGGQAAAALVALGMAQAHENAVAAVVAWAVVTVAEAVFSTRSRAKLVDAARNNWGRN